MLDAISANASLTNREHDPSCRSSVALIANLGSTVSHSFRRSLGQIAVTQAALIGSRSASDILAVHYDTLSLEERAAVRSQLRANTTSPTLFLLESFEPSELVTLFGEGAMRNMLVVNNSAVDALDLVVTVQKLRTCDVFGLEKYFVWGVATNERTCACSSESTEVIKEIDACARERGVGARLRAMIRTVTDEFLSNAFYNAPVDAEGRRIYEGQSRTRPVTLDAHDAVQVRYCCDGRRFGLSVTDAFGSLTPEVLQQHLARAFRRGDDQVSEKEGGAGVGLYQIFGSLSHFIINIEPGVKTEMIGLIDVSSTYRAFARGGRSFNIFVKENRR